MDNSNKDIQVYGDNVENSVSIETSNINPVVKSNALSRPLKKPNSRRMRRTTYQAKLGKKLDAINLLVLDNNIRLSGHPTDMLRIEINRNNISGDPISHTVKSVEVLPVILPKMEDIPMRHFIRNDTDLLIPSLYTIQQQEYFEVYSPVEVDVNENDLLIRILNDTSPDIDESYVMVLEVKDVLGTFGYSSLAYKKLIVTYCDYQLPSKIITEIKSAIKKREILGW